MARSSLLLDLELDSQAQHDNAPLITEVSSRRRNFVEPAVLVIGDQQYEATCTKLADDNDENLSMRTHHLLPQATTRNDEGGSIFHWDDRLDCINSDDDGKDVISTFQKELKQENDVARISFAGWMKRTANHVLCDGVHVPPSSSSSSGTSSPVVQQSHMPHNNKHVNLPQSSEAAGASTLSLKVDEGLRRQQKSRLLVAVAILSTTVRSELRERSEAHDNTRSSASASELLVEFLDLFLDPLVTISKVSSSRTNLTAQSFKLACLLIYHTSICGSHAQPQPTNEEEEDAYKIFTDKNENDNGSSIVNQIQPRACNLIWKSLLTIRNLVLCRRLWNEAYNVVRKQDQRRACNSAVIADFLDIVDGMIKLYHEDRCQPNYEVDLIFAEKVHLCQQFAGTVVNIKTEGSSISTIRRLGGFACMEPDLLDKCSAECMVDITLKSAQLHLQPPDEMNRSAVGESQRKIARAFASWLSSKSKSSLSRKFMPGRSKGSTTALLSPLLHRAMEANITLMSSSPNACVNLSLAALNCLWSESNGIPPDIFNNDRDCVNGSPRSFDILVDILRSDSSNRRHSKEKKSCAPSRALHVLVARCICSKPLLFPRLICRLDICDATVEVAKILSQENTSDKKLANAVCRFLLDNIGDKRVQVEAKEVALFKYARNDIVIPRLLKYIFNKKSNGAAASAASDSICHLLLLSEDEVVMNALAKEICKADNSEDPSNGEEETKSLIDIVGPFVGFWRRTLIERGNHSSYASALLCLGRHMVGRPSQSAPLTLFGAFVGDGSDFDAADPNAQGKIRFAVLSIVRFACQFLSGERTSDRIDTEIIGGNEVFERLSPLLMLRRIPSVYFRICHSIRDDERYQILAKLATELSLRLGIENCLASVTYSSEEMRLSAELAGRCLTFDVGGIDEDHLISCFGTFCEPAFRKLILALFDPSTKMISESKALLYKKARAGIYAACHAIPSMTNYSISSTALTRTIGFALRIMCTDEEDDSDYLQLQTGCTEFISICIERWLIINDDGCNVTYQDSDIIRGSNKIHDDNAYSSLIIEELHGDVDDRPSSLPSIKEDLLSLSDVLPLVLSVFTAGFIPSRLERIWSFWPAKETHHFVVIEMRRTKGHESAAATINCMNAIILASKRCSDEEENKALLTLKGKCIPMILSWSESCDRLESSPLSVAVALQLVFVLITRSRTFDGFDDGSLSVAHRWSLNAVKAKERSGNEYALGIMRSSGLKLMLAIVTIAAQTDNLEMCLSLNPGEFGETISVLRGAANLDANIEVRKLAFNILSAMNMT